MGKNQLLEEMEKEDRRYREALRLADREGVLLERLEELSNESRRKQLELFNLHWHNRTPTADNTEPVFQTNQPATFIP